VLEARAGSRLHNTPWFLVDRTDPARPSVEERTGGYQAATPAAVVQRVSKAVRSQAARKAYEQLTSDAKLRDELKALYGDDINQLEWYVGIFAEEYPSYLMRRPDVDDVAATRSLRL